MRKSTDAHKSVEEKDNGKIDGAVDDPEVDDMVVGSFEPEVVVEAPVKPKIEQGSIREDVDDIVNGALACRICDSFLMPVQIHCTAFATDHPSAQEHGGQSRPILLSTKSFLTN